MSGIQTWKSPQYPCHIPVPEQVFDRETGYVVSCIPGTRPDTRSISVSKTSFTIRWFPGGIHLDVQNHSVVYGVSRSPFTGWCTNVSIWLLTSFPFLFLYHHLKLWCWWPKSSSPRRVTECLCPSSRCFCLCVSQCVSVVIKVSYRSMVTTGDPVPVGQWDVPVNHFTG